MFISYNSRLFFSGQFCSGSLPGEDFGTGHIGQQGEVLVVVQCTVGDRENQWENGWKSENHRKITLV